MRIMFIANGEDVPVEADPEKPLRDAAKAALELSQNTGRPAEEWEVRNATGILLEKGRLVREFGFKEGERLFLSLQVGAGGNAGVACGRPGCTSGAPAAGRARYDHQGDARHDQVCLACVEWVVQQADRVHEIRRPCPMDPVDG